MYAHKNLVDLARGTGIPPITLRLWWLQGHIKMEDIKIGGRVYHYFETDEDYEKEKAKVLARHAKSGRVKLNNNGRM